MRQVWEEINRSSTMSSGFYAVKNWLITINYYNQLFFSYSTVIGQFPWRKVFITDGPLRR